MRFVELCAHDGLLDGTLGHALVEMVPVGESAVRRNVGTRGREEPAPVPIQLGVGVLVAQGGRHLDANSRAEVLLVPLTRGLELRTQSGDELPWHHRATVFVALSAAYSDFAALEVEVLHSQSATLEQPEPGTV